MSFTKKSLGVENKSAVYCQLSTLQLDALCLLCASAFTLAFFPAHSPKIKSFNSHQTSTMEGDQKTGMQFQTASVSWQTTYFVSVPKVLSDNSQQLSLLYF